MKPELLKKVLKINLPVFRNDLASFPDNTGDYIEDSGISISEYNNFINEIDKLINHVSNNEIHVTQENKETWNKSPDISGHLVNNSIHVTSIDRENWNVKETPNGAQAKCNLVQTNVNKHINDPIPHVTATERAIWADKYSRTEIDNKLSAYEYATEWKSAVNTYNDILITYPEPKDGWTVNTLDTDITYRFDGDKWITISANSIPLATNELDGKMSSADKAKLDTVEFNANNYIHPDDENIRHVTDEEKSYWNSKANSDLVTYKINGLMSIEDKQKLDNIEDGATYYEHPEYHDPSIINQNENNRFVTDEQIESWNNKSEANLASIQYDGLMSREDKKKLDEIEEGANNYIHPSYHTAKTIIQDEEHRFVTDVEKESYTKGLVIASEITMEDVAILKSVEQDANNYVHPESHPATIIEEDEDHLFVSREQIKDWDAKKEENDFIVGTGIFNGNELVYPEYDSETQEVIDGKILNKDTQEIIGDYIGSQKGTVIVHTFKNTSFAVNVMRSSRKSEKSVGEIYCIKENDKVTVYNDGENNVDSFDFILIRYDK